MDTILKITKCDHGPTGSSLNLVTLPSQTTHLFVGSCEDFDVLPLGKGFNVFYYEIPNQHLDWILFSLERGEEAMQVTEIQVSNRNSCILEEFSRIVLSPDMKFYAGSTLIVVDFISNLKIQMTSKFKKKIVRYNIEVMDLKEFLIGSSDDCSIFIKGQAVYGKLLFKYNEWVVESQTDMWIPYSSSKNLNKSLPLEVKFKSGFKARILNQKSSLFQDFP